MFSQEHVDRELSQYRSQGPDKTARMLMEAIKEVGVRSLTLLDTGGGVGAIQHALIEAERLPGFRSPDPKSRSLAGK